MRVSVGATGCAGKTVAFLVFGLFLGLGLFFLVATTRVFLAALDTYRWQRVPCRIEASQVTDSGTGDSRYGFSVSYTYTAGGTEHRSDRYTVADARTSDYSAEQKRAERYPAGSNAFCYVNPKDPDQSVLERSGLIWGLLLLLPLVFVVIGGGGLLATLGVFRGRGSGTDKPLSAAASGPRKGALGMALFFSLFLAVGLVVSYFLLVRPATSLLRARTWNATPCTVLSSSVGSHRGSKGEMTYSVDVLYSYAVDGREYRSSRYDFIGGSSSGSEGKAAVVKRYPAGRRATCFVDPDDPHEAVLDRSFSARYLVGLFPLIFVAVGAGGLVFGLRKALRSGREGLMGNACSPSRAGLPLAPAGPVELHAKASPLGKLVGVIFLACFWNGIVSVFVWQAWSSARRGHPEVGLSLFLIPFLLVGVGLLGAVVYQFLALFNPRLHLTVSGAPAEPGGWLDVEWRFTGLPSRLSRFRMTLQAREEATVRQGKSSQTLKSTFASVPVTDVRSAPDVGAGRARVQIPPGTMHSFDGGACKVVWALKAHGDIARWPDVDEEFEVAVLPAARGGRP